MSRVVTSPRRDVRRGLRLLLSACLALGLGLPATAQELPPCGDGRTSDCRLAGWSGEASASLESAFGDIEGIAWIEDEQGDAPPGGVDILAAGIGRVDVADPKAVRESDGLLKQGKAKKAVPKGEAMLVRIVLDQRPETAGGPHASVHLATDINGSRSSNVPSGVASPDFPFSGSQDVYSLTWASTTGKTRLLASDLAKGWYRSKRPFAASWAAPGVLDLLIAPSGLGEGFRIIAHAAGADGGYDTLALGPVAIPADGVVELAPSCLEGSIRNEPIVIPRLVEQEQVVRDVEAPASWQGGMALPLGVDEAETLAGFIREHDEDGDGRVSVPAWVDLFEDGTVTRQATELAVAIKDQQALLATELGLTRRGYDVLRDFQADPTGEAGVDAWLERATDVLREAMPPFRVGKRAGLLLGGTQGACVPWLAPAVAELPEPSASPAPASLAPAPEA